MGRCRCSGPECTCLLTAGPGTTITGDGSSGDPYVISSDGGGEATALGASISRSTPQTIPDVTFTVVQFDTEEWDSDGMATLVANNDRLTATRAGVYTIDYQNQWTPSDAGTYRFIALDLNSTGTYPAADRRVPLGPSHAGVSWIVRLAVNDYVRAVVYQNSGTPNDLIAGYPTLTAVYLGA